VPTNGDYWVDVVFDSGPFAGELHAVERVARK
jgi:hypothetical protein